MVKIAEMSRAELYAQLARLKYEGPTSYRKEKLREIVAEVSGKGPDHNFKAITGTKAGKETFGGPGRPAGGVEEREAKLFALFCKIAGDHSLVKSELEDGDRALLRTLVNRGVVVQDLVNGEETVWQLALHNDLAMDADEDTLARFYAGEWDLVDA